jgi:hypothetical protein
MQWDDAKSGGKLCGKQKTFFDQQLVSDPGIAASFPTDDELIGLLNVHYCDFMRKLENLENGIQ